MLTKLIETTYSNTNVLRLGPVLDNGILTNDILIGTENIFNTSKTTDNSVGILPSDVSSHTSFISPSD
jgi:hypothetical protein